MGPKLSVSVQNSVTKKVNTSIISYVQNINRQVETTILVGGTINLEQGENCVCKKGIIVSSTVNSNTIIYSELTAEQTTDLKSKLQQETQTAFDAVVENEGNLLSSLGPSLGVTVQNIKNEIDNYFESSNVQGIDVSQNTRVIVGNTMTITLNGYNGGLCEARLYTNAVTEVQDKIAASLQGLVDSESMQKVINEASAAITNKTFSLIAICVIAGSVGLVGVAAIKIFKKQKQKPAKGRGREAAKSGKNKSTTRK